MPPSLKDSDTQTPTETPARNGSAATTDSLIKPQPVALEIPITVNGARTAEGSEKREPFSESTKTVMVFGSGAVIRSSTSLAPGQLLFVTNERSKKEVVCQVVKSKNYRNVSGYVELEFTEPAVGFWGMRFPGDRIGPGPQASTPEVSSSGAGEESPAPPPSVARQPASSTPSSSVASKPSSPATPSSKPVATAAPSFSVVSPPTNTGSSPGSTKSKPGSGVMTTPVATSLGSDEPLVEPWLKKRAPVSKVPPGPARTTAPESKAKSEELEDSLPTAPKFALTRPSDKPASLFTPAEAPAKLSGVDLSTLAPFFEVKPAPGETLKEPKAAAARDPETEELKHHTARLQEELSQMKFAEPTGDSPAKRKAELPARLEEEAPSFPLSELAISAIKTDLVHNSAARLVEDSSESEAAPLLPELPSREASSKKASSPVIPALESLEQEELKIPAWLEPLARNASAPSSTQELVFREKAKCVAEQPPWQELAAPLVAPVKKKEEQAAESRVPQFGSVLPFEEAKRTRGSETKKSGKGMLFAGLVAGILVLAGGAWWFMNQQATGVHASPSSSNEMPSASATSPDLQANSAKESALGAILPAHADATTSPAKTTIANSKGQPNSANAASNAAPINAPATAGGNAQTTANLANGGNTVIQADSAWSEPEPGEEKKPALGEVHLAAPKVSPKRMAQSGAAPDAAILSEDQVAANPDSLGTGLGGAEKQPAAPAAPVTVGGDVKQAKLISTVPPVYPELAKAQHVSGAVTIDALIDANGHVTKMKVISGPTLLQEAAMDALKQWKYQPATLDGKAVPMHLTVTIQFRLQK